MTVIRRDILTKEELAIIEANTAAIKELAIEVRQIEYGTSKTKRTDLTPEKQERLTEIGKEISRFAERNKALTVVAEHRYTSGLGSAAAVYKDAIEIVEAADKEDFRDFIRSVMKDFGGKDNETLRKKSKEFRTYMHFDFKSARVFLLQLVKPHIDYLKKHDEKPDGIDFTYLELLDVTVYRKVRDEWKYKQPVEKQPEKQKKETINSLDYEEASDVYTKRLEDKFIKDVGTAIGENPPLDIQAQKKVIPVSGNSDIEWVFIDTELTQQEMEELCITTESYLILDMLLEKITKQVPPIPSKNKDGSPNEKQLEKVLSKLQDEDTRTVTLTREEYLEERHIKENKGRQKEIFEYAIMSIGTMRGKMDTNVPYYLFSSPPHEAADMYSKGDIIAVFNYDWLKHLYKDGLKGKGQIVFRPKPLRSVDLKKHPFVVVLWNFMQNNYNYNVGKQNTHTNRVKVGTAIDRIPDFRKRDEAETNGNRRFSQRIIKPLHDNLEALDKVYKIIDYEYLDNKRKPITKKKFLSMKYAQQKECWIRYEFVDYPNWRGTEQLGTK